MNEYKCGSQSQAVFARRRSKSKLKLLDIREERKRRKRRSGISSDDTKYSALVANLDAETLSYVSDIVLSPPNSDKYHTLSQRLITQFSDSETQKIKKLLTDLQLGDEKASHLLRKMKELSNGQLQDDFLQSLWLQRMPPHIQTVLSASSEPLDKLAIIADKVSEVVGASSTICAAKTVPPPSQSSSCSAQSTMDSLARQIQELSLQVAELTRERNSSRHQRYSSDHRRSHSRSRSVNRGSGICYYHRRYKEKARKCVSPCAKKRVSSVIAGMAEPSQHTSRLFLLESKSGHKLLIDSGSEICVIPPSPTMNKSPQSNFSLFAANNAKIPAYAFQRCKQALADAALLAHPSPSAPLALHVDASDYAIGGSDNIAADVLSRVSAITPSQVKLIYDCIAETQQTDQELHTLIASGTSLELKRKCRTTGYHPQANGMIEELHRPLKSVIKCPATERWTEVLPIILLGLRASLKKIFCVPQLN
ncbi:uncharacterized protein TNCV_5003981 [Trichonephila clavipes]|nr:uncharacterized protein TNCV_5003981 [Trichonephila clavipes]